ncbi:hypothetical protein HK104_010906, partial [Borealophlyctis nickersoniae]
YLSSGFSSGVEKGLKRMMGGNVSVNEVCIECGRRLTEEGDLYIGPTDAGGHVYCEGCYARHFKKGDCQKCYKPVLGLGREYVNQDGKFWHKECFDQGKSCHECSQIVFGQGLEALGKIYHPDCFKVGQCFNCHSPITGSFVDFNTEPCCKPCHDKIKLTRPSAAVGQPAAASAISQPLPASQPMNQGVKELAARRDVKDLQSRCDKCLEVVTDGGVQLPNGMLFHDKCFLCETCARPIDGKYVLEERKVYHQQCRFTVASSTSNPVCAKCSKPVSGRFVKHDNGMYHSDCFICSHCSKPLANTPFGDTPNGPVCESCLTNITTAAAAAARQGPSTWTPGFTINAKSGLKEVRGPGGVKVGDNAALKALGGSNKCPACDKAVYMSDQTQLDSMAKMKDLTPYCWKCYEKS